MNNDDTFKNTNNNNDHTSAGLTPELEVRVVAWVLGEATPAEAAELARLAATHAALADFKRRIEAVHGLVGAAARPVNDVTLRLSDERRAKVLAVIGEDAPEASEERTEDRGSATPRWVLAWNKWALPMAACITLCVLLGVVIKPEIGFSKKPKRPDPSSTLLGASFALGPSFKQEVVDNSLRSEEAPMVTFNRDASAGDESMKIETARRSRVSLRNAPVAAATMPAPSAAPAPMIMNGTGTLTLGSANTYSGGTVVTGGMLGLDAAEQTKSLTKAGAGRLAGEKRQLYAANQEMASADGFAESAPATPAPVTASRGGSLELNGYSSVSGLERDADRSRATLFDTAQRNDIAGKDQSGVVDAYVANDKLPVLGDVQLEGRLFKNSEVANDALKSDLGVGTRMPQSAAEADDSYPVHAAQAQEQGQGKAAGVTITAGTVQYFESSGVVTGQLQSAAPKQAKKRQTVTITAGTPQEFEVRQLTVAEEMEYQLKLSDQRKAVALDADQAKAKKSNDGKVQNNLLAKSSMGSVSIPLSQVSARRFLHALSEEQPRDDISEGLKAFFQRAGVDFNGVAGAKLTYDGEALIVSQTPRNIERLRNIVARYPDLIESPDIKKIRAEISTAIEAVSTFSLHVSDASFRIAKAALARGEAPDPSSIRPEEFYNAFDYGDPSAVAGEPVACRIEQSAHPFLQQRNLVRIAMKVPATGRGAGQPLRLTVLLDTSGSMEREDRAAAVRAALTSLVSLLGADDRITLIGFARQPHLLADRVPGNQAAGLADLVAKTPFEGGTNLEEALKLAGNLARGQFTASAQNRIVLLTDGAANLGNDDPAQLAEMIVALRQQGIAFDACGVGADGLDDTILEALTRKGDGRYTVINSPEEADAGFAHKLAGAFRPAAENVKVQVRFNPSRVAHYRLIGFEQHRLKTEDFRNDRVDAAELAAEEAAVALYQVEVLPDGEGELGEAFVRFRDVATGNMVERSWTLSYAPQPPAFARATPSMKLAGTAAFLAEKLRGGDLAAQIRLDELAPVVNALRSDYANDARVQDLVTMFAQARRLTGE